MLERDIWQTDWGDLASEVVILRCGELVKTGGVLGLQIMSTFREGCARKEG